ncbi:carboxymuconolactone decarboxylase family protein [Glycomyces tenuis]|uniref:carboxymuconolactone decarboxylase family protein n=1 Tax=Glycomyces tenuis TaxID=58116 RepID=UPI00040A5ADC|nr:carboxymuconolactone decarboxylase family protein [Glycomyces tenuis]
MAPTVRHVTPVLPEAADGLVAEVYRQAKAELGITVGPPFMMLSPAPELLAPMWALLRESLLVGGPAERTAKEVVATTIAVKNACRFCADAHALMLHAAGEHELAEAVRDGGAPYAHADLAEWAAAPSLDGPFSASAAPRFIGTALVFEFITRLVKVLAHNASPHPVTATKLGRAVASRQVREAVAADLEPGLSLPLLDRREPWLKGRWPTLDLTVPDWGGASPVGRAYAHLRAVASCGRRLLDEQVAHSAEQAIERSVGWWGSQLVTGPIAVGGIEDLPDRAALGARLVAAAALDPGSIDDDAVAVWRAGALSDHSTVFVFGFAVMQAVDQMQSNLIEMGTIDA